MIPHTLIILLKELRMKLILIVKCFSSIIVIYTIHKTINAQQFLGFNVTVIFSVYNNF